MVGKNYLTWRYIVQSFFTILEILPRSYNISCISNYCSVSEAKQELEMDDFNSCYLSYSLSRDALRYITWHCGDLIKIFLAPFLHWSWWFVEILREWCWFQSPTTEVVTRIQSRFFLFVLPDLSAISKPWRAQQEKTKRATIHQIYCLRKSVAPTKFLFCTGNK